MMATSNVSVDTAAASATMLSASMAGTAGQQAVSAPVSASASPPSPGRGDKAAQGVDTVTLVSKPSEMEKAEVKAEAVRVAKAREEERREKQAAAGIGEVMFTYNSRGDLRVRFMDSKHGLIYQTPPVMYARMNDLMLQMKVSVNTQA